MILLDKVSPDSAKWVVKVGGGEYILGEHGDYNEDDTYIFPVSSALELNIRDFKDFELQDLPSELTLIINNYGRILGNNISCIWLNSSNNKPSLVYYWEIETHEWEGSLNPYALRNTIHGILENDVEYFINFESNPRYNEGGSATLCIEIKADSIEEHWDKREKFATFLNDSFDLAEEKVSVGGFSEKVVAKFNFNKESLHAYSAYISYFIEFLKDIGIDAAGEFKHDSDSIVLSISPNNKDIALTNISEALSAYLKLPSISIETDLVSNLDPISEFKFEKLRSEIERLKSSLRVSEALVKYQDTLISHHETNKSVVSINSRKNDIIDGLSYVYVDDKEQEKKSFLGGGIKLGVFTKFGVDFDLSKILSHFQSKK